MQSDLDIIKQHLRITSTDEDEIITQYVEAAEELVQKYLNMAFDDIYDEYGQVPAAITTAICLLTASMYQNREAWGTVDVRTNPVCVALLRQYKRLAI